MSRCATRSGIFVAALAVGSCLVMSGCALKSDLEKATKTLAADIASVRTTADANKTAIATLQKQVAALDAAVKGLLALEERVGQAERLLTSHATKLGELETAGRKTDARVAVAEKLAGDAATKASVDAVMKDLAAKVAAQATETARVAAKFERMTAMSDQVIQDLERVKNAQTKLDSTMSTLDSWAKTSLAAQDKIIASDRKTLADILQAEYATLAERMKELRAAIEKLKAASTSGGASG